MTNDKIVRRNSQDGFDRFEIEGDHTRRKHQTYRKYLEIDSKLTDSKVYTCVRRPFERLVSFYFAAFRWVKKDPATNKIIIPARVEFKEKEFIEMARKLPTCLFYLRVDDKSKEIAKEINYMRTEQLEKDFAESFPGKKLTSSRNRSLYPELKRKILDSNELRKFIENSRHKMDLDTFYS